MAAPATTSLRRNLWILKCGAELVACLLVTEISGPLLHLTEMLKELGIKDTDLNLLVDVLFAVTFSVARMVWVRMGKKGKWFSAVRRVFSSSDPEGKEAKAEKVDKPKSRRKWLFGKSKHSDPSTSTVSGTTPVAPTPLPLPPPPPTQSTQTRSEEIKDVKPAETENEQNKHAYSVALASAVAAEAAAVAAQTAAEVVYITAVPTGRPKTPVFSKEEHAVSRFRPPSGVIWQEEHCGH